MLFMVVFFYRNTSTRLLVWFSRRCDKILQVFYFVISAYLLCSGLFVSRDIIRRDVVTHL